MVTLHAAAKIRLVIFLSPPHPSPVMRSLPAGVLVCAVLLERRAGSCRLAQSRPYPILSNNVISMLSFVHVFPNFPSVEHAGVLGLVSLGSTW